MPTSISRLKGKILAIMDDYDNIAPADKAAARDDFSQKLATAIVEEIKEAQINYVSGLANGAGAVTGTFNHTIS